MSSNFLKLPTIDFSDQELKPGNALWNSLKIQVRVALEEYGCFEALYPKIPCDLRKAIFDAIAQVFELPLDTKRKSGSNMFSRAYIGQHPKLPLYESLAILDANVLEKFESFTKILWPEGNPDFSKTLHYYAEKLSELDQVVRRMVLDSLDVEQYIDEQLESTNYILRVIKYKEPQTNDAKLGLTSHTDTNLLTILYQNQVNGLEVETKDGQWISVKPSPDSFLVVSGESFHGWTNGRLHAPYHRVMMTGNQTRYSIGLFATPKDGYMIKTPEDLVDENHPLLYRPFDHKEFLKFYYSYPEEARKAKPPLEAYCGV